jgi:hypothetical protein
MMRMVFGRPQTHISEARCRTPASVALLMELLWGVSAQAQTSQPVGRCRIGGVPKAEFFADSARRSKPEMVSPWSRATAPAGSPYPQWNHWDEKIATLQKRLDEMPNR